MQAIVTTRLFVMPLKVFSFQFVASNDNFAVSSLFPMTVLFEAYINKVKIFSKQNPVVSIRKYTWDSLVEINGQGASWIVSTPSCKNIELTSLWGDRTVFPIQRATYEIKEFKMATSVIRHWTSKLQGSLGLKRYEKREKIAYQSRHDFPFIYFKLHNCNAFTILYWETLGVFER